MKSGLKFHFTLAYRLGLSERGQSLHRWVSAVAALGIALGVFTLTLVTSTINGFREELYRSVSGINGDVFVYSREIETDPVDSEAFLDSLKRDFSSLPQPTFVLDQEALILSADTFRGALIEGIDFSKDSIPDIQNLLIDGELPLKDNEVVLGSALAQELDAHVGDELQAYLPGRIDSPVDLVVSGISKLGMYSYDSRFAFVQRASLQVWTGVRGASSMRFRLGEDEKAKLLARKLDTYLAYPYRAKHWSELNRNLLAAIELEKWIIAILLNAIILVGALTVVSALLLMAQERAKDLAILKAMGLRPREMMVFFHILAFGMGIVGVAVGLFTGIGAAWLVAKTELIQLPPEIYFLSYLPTHFKPFELLLISLVALGVVLLSVLLPAWRASREAPMKGLREQS